MSTVATRPRHDRADLRRLAEFGYEPMQWRRPPAAASRRSVIVLSEPAPAKGLLADLLRGLILGGHPLQQRVPTEGATLDSKALIVRFDSASAAGITESTSASAAVVLPAVSELRGNPTAKRAAWAALRAALR